MVNCFKSGCSFENRGYLECLAYFTNGNVRYGRDKYNNIFDGGIITYNNIENSYLLYNDVGKIMQTEVSLDNIPGSNDNTLKYYNIYIDTSAEGFIFYSVKITFKDNPNIRYFYAVEIWNDMGKKDINNTVLLENNYLEYHFTEDEAKRDFTIGFVYVNEDDVGKSLDFTLECETKKPSNNNS